MGRVVLSTTLAAPSMVSTAFDIELLVPNIEPAALSSGPTHLAWACSIHYCAYSTYHDAYSEMLTELTVLSTGFVALSTRLVALGVVPVVLSTGHKEPSSVQELLFIHDILYHVCISQTLKSFSTPPSQDPLGSISLSFTVYVWSL